MTPPSDPAPRQDAAADRAVRGSALLRAVEVMDALRSEGGDAWSARQTHQSLARYLLEESHEVLDVLEDPAAHRPQEIVDELGDLLFQILFHARIGQDENPAWDVDDVARAFVAKMERRNPHVFGDGADQALQDADDVEQIIAQWHAVKAAEKQHRTGGDDSFHASIPTGLPALQRAAKVVHRARSAGRLDAVLATAEAAAGRADAPEGADIGMELLWVVADAEKRDVDAESALRSLLRRMERAGAGPMTDSS